jgi:hypothetical protein
MIKLYIFDKSWSIGRCQGVFWWPKFMAFPWLLHARAIAVANQGTTIPFYASNVRELNR